MFEFKTNYMKKTFTLIAAAMFLGTINTNAQCTGDRYTMQIFSSSDVASDIVYGNNYTYTGAAQDQKLDVYTPTGDTETNRPLLILAHGGSFIGGSKTGTDVVPLAQHFAKMGYVVASINYRIGFEDLFSGTLDSVFATETVVRSVHDFRAAIRFFKKDFSENGNTYGIDTSLIFGGGVSAGAITAVHVGYLDELSELPTYIDTTKLGLGGGIEGNSGNPNYTSKGLVGIINIAGAIRDTNWITSTSIPLLSLHGDQDGTVPFGTDIIWLSGTWEIMRVDGSASCHERANNIGLDNCFFPHYGQDHIPHVGNAAYTDTTETLMRNFMSSYVCGQTMVCGYNGTTQTDVSVAETLSSKTNVYPNPANDFFRIDSEVLIEEISIINLLGEIVSSESNVNSTTFEMQRNNIPSGVYLLAIKTTNGVKTKKISFE